LAGPKGSQVPSLEGWAAGWSHASYPYGRAAGRRGAKEGLDITYIHVLEFLKR